MTTGQSRPATTTQKKHTHMSHEIHENDTVVLGSNKPAWHGLGTVFAGLLSPLRAYIEGVGAREMFESPVLFNGQPVDGYKIISGRYANGAHSALSVVGDSYGLLKDSRFFEILEKVYGGRAVVETAGTPRNGKRIWVLVKRDSWCVSGKDRINTFDLWVNRHDGSGCFELHRTNVRVVCQNTWNLAIGSGRQRVFGVRHTVNVEGNIAQAIRFVEMADEQARIEQDKARILAERVMVPSSADSFFRRLLVVDPFETEVKGKVGAQLDDLNRLFVRGAGNSGVTRWDAFNAVTEFVDHSRTVRAGNGRSKAEARFESVLLGTGDDMKARAFDLLQTLD